MATGVVRGITPGSSRDGMPYITDVPEASSQTYKLGAPVLLNASGIVAEIATSGTTLWGIAVKDGQNGASNSAKTAKVYKITPDALFEGTLSVASWDQSLVGSKVGFSQASSTWFLATGTAVSANAQCVIRGVSSKWAAGDTNPQVIFSVLNSMIQGEV